MPLVLDTDQASFLSEYWQQRPLFIPQGFPGFKPPADADELAGLALEPGIDSRIIACSEGHWTQEHGPFSEEAFARTGAWSLLVQSVDQHWDDAAELLRAVEFLPSWRLDDVMMSYASDGGSAGPHFDNYDVFIIQGDGQRRWQLGQHCTPASPLLPHAQLRLLSEFQASDEYVMSCGDVIYIPPGVAHYGVSIGDSTSFSIGFRAPRLSELLARWTDLSLESLSGAQLLRDPRRKITTRVGEISHQDLSDARAQLVACLNKDDPRWFGETVTQAISTEQADADAKHTVALLQEIAAKDGSSDDVNKENILLCKTPDSRIAWFEQDSVILVFAQGESLPVTADLQPVVEALCGGSPLTLKEILAQYPNAVKLLTWLAEEGALTSLTETSRSL